MGADFFCLFPLNLYPLEVYLGITIVPTHVRPWIWPGAHQNGTATVFKTQKKTSDVKKIIFLDNKKPVNSISI